MCPLLFANVFGPWGWVIIGGVFLLLFGANRLPELMRSLGRSVTEFKKGINEGAGNEDDPNKKIDKP